MENAVSASVNGTALKLGGAQTIDEVIAQMDTIISWSENQKSRLGYFAALYRKVTVQVREGIHTGMFDDGPRMERLDVTFANRYLDALNSYLNGQPASECWMVAFTQTESAKPLIMQHLLLGMNAHINLDLGIAAATVCPGEEIASLKDDFMKINSVLASLVDEVRGEIDELPPWIDLLDNISPKASDAIVNFSMEKARNEAWAFAQQLAPLSETDQLAAILHKDNLMAIFGRLVANPPGLFVKLGLWIIGMRESRNIVRNITVLNQGHVISTPSGVPMAQ